MDLSYPRSRDRSILAGLNARSIDLSTKILQKQGFYTRDLSNQEIAQNTFFLKIQYLKRLLDQVIHTFPQTFPQWWDLLQIQALWIIWIFARQKILHFGSLSISIIKGSTFRFYRVIHTVIHNSILVFHRAI